MKRSIVFIVDLVQDVNTLRPVMALARRETAHDLIVIASSTFDTLNSTAVWGRELREICGMLAIPIYRFTSEFEAVQLLQGRGGLLISASELGRPCACPFAQSVSRGTFGIRPGDAAAWL